LELWHQSAKLGYAAAYCNIGSAYHYGRGLEKDSTKKAKQYWELAVIGRNTSGRFNLGVEEMKDGNPNRALKRFMIAVEEGHHESLKLIQEIYKAGLVTKDDYGKALQAYQAYVEEIRSDQRDKAAAHSEHCKYM
jgi:TPR repeat protein